MFTSRLIVSYLLFAIPLLSRTQACDLPHTNSSSPIEMDDTPSDPATTGYKLNHFCLYSSNITSAKHFYGTVLGMRLLFTIPISPEFTITYMGYARGGLNGTGYQTAEELNREKPNREGLLEIVNFSGAKKIPPSSTTVTNTFSHVGLVVPDVLKTQERMEQFGVKILKRVSAEDFGNIDRLANAYGLGPDMITNESTLEELKAGLRSIGFPQALVVEDPDGNIVEILPQT